MCVKIQGWAELGRVGESTVVVGVPRTKRNKWLSLSCPCEQDGRSEPPSGNGYGSPSVCSMQSRFLERALTERSHTDGIGGILKNIVRAEERRIRDPFPLHPIRW